METEQEQLSTRPGLSVSIETNSDYITSLKIGLIMAIFAMPTVHEVVTSGKYTFFPNSIASYFTVFVALPLIALAGIFIARVLFFSMPRFWEFIKFILVGVSNTVVDLGVLNLLITATGSNRGIIISLFGAVSFLIATTNSYTWNAHWSFKTTTTRTTEEMVKFFSVTLVGLFIKTAVIYIAQTYVHQNHFSANLWANISDICAIILTLIWNFIGFKLFVFKNTLLPEMTNN